MLYAGSSLGTLCFIKRYKRTIAFCQWPTIWPIKDIILTHRTRCSPMQFSTNDNSGDILVVPPRLADIAAIQIPPNSAYIMRRDAFLAKTERVSVDLTLGSSRRKQGVRILLIEGVV